MKRHVKLSSPYGDVTIQRNEHGHPVIQAGSRGAVFFGQGYAQAMDRQIQTMLMKAIFTGRMAELLSPEQQYVDIDAYMRRYAFSHRPQDEWEKLPEACRTGLVAHADGINAWVDEHGLVWELRLAGFVREPWTWHDTLAIARGFAFVGLGDTQAALEKWLMQMLAGGTSYAQLQELLPSLCDPDFSELYRQVHVAQPLLPDHVRRRLPGFRASNNWVLGPGRSQSGHALMAGDPHLDIDRLPAIWQEMVLDDGAVTFLGVGLPGVPGALLGRTRDLSWTPTYACIDSVDFRIEECRRGQYRRGNEWRDFHRRTEIIKLKGGGRHELTFLENENGVLEGDTATDGLHLIENYATRFGCGASDVAGMFALLDAKTVPEGMRCLQQVQASSFNWLLADRSGSIGYQMSGRHFVRPPGTSGLMALPAWDDTYAYRGYVEGAELPKALDPPEGFLVTANDDRNCYGTSNPCAIHFGHHRKNRITTLLAARDKWTAADLGTIQNDVCSLQAEAFLTRFAALVPETPAGRLLLSWDRRYTLDSRAAVLFERFYRALLRNTFGKLVWGVEVIDYLLDQTGAFVAFYHYFDRLLLDGNRHWFTREQIEQAARAAFAEALAQTPPRLAKTRRMKMGHLLFVRKLPSWLGFDGGPLAVPGSRATPCQCQIFTDRGRTACFAPSYRFLCDMGADEALTSLPGGASDRRFGRSYKNELGRYLRGEYKRLRFAYPSGKQPRS